MQFLQKLSILLHIRKVEGHGFKKDLRECSDGVFVEKIKKYMIDFSITREENEKIIIMPLVSKVVGEYPKDYKGVEDER